MPVITCSISKFIITLFSFFYIIARISFLKNYFVVQTASFRILMSIYLHDIYTDGEYDDLNIHHHNDQVISIILGPFEIHAAISITLYMGN